MSDYIEFSEHILPGLTSISEIKYPHQHNIDVYFIDAILENDIDTVKKMLEIGMIPMDTRYIMNACTSGYVDILQCLLKWRGKHGEYIDIRNPDSLPIIAAIQRGNLQFVEELLKWRGPHNEQIMVDPFIFGEACRSGRTKIVRLLLNWRGPRNEQVMVTENCMNAAVTLRWLEIVRLLLAWRGPHGQKAPIFDEDAILTMNCIDEIAELLYVPIYYQSFREARRELNDIKDKDATRKVVLEQKMQDYLMLLVAHLDLLDEEQRKDIYPFIENEPQFRGINAEMMKHMFFRPARRSPKPSARRSPKPSARRSPKPSARRSPFGKRR